MIRISEWFRVICMMLIASAFILPGRAFSQSRVAAEMYRVAGRSLETPNREETFVLWDVLDAPLDDAAKQVINRNAKALSAFDGASQIPFGDWGYDANDTNYAGKTLVGAEQLSDLVVLRSRLRAADGQYAQALDDCYNIANLARRFSVQPSLARQVLQDKLFDKALSAAGLMMLDAPKDQVQKLVNRLDELHSPADPIDVTLAQKQAYVWFYRKVVGDPDVRNKLDNALALVGEAFGVKGDPIDVSDLVGDPNLADQVFADTEAAFNKVIDAMKLPTADRTEAVRNAVRLLHSSHPLVRGASLMANQAYQLSLVQPMKIELFRMAAKICAELPQPIDESRARQLVGTHLYSRVPGGFELIGTVEGLDQPVIIRVGPRPLRARPTTTPSPKAN